MDLERNFVEVDRKYLVEEQEAEEEEDVEKEDEENEENLREEAVKDEEEVDEEKAYVEAEGIKNTIKKKKWRKRLFKLISCCAKK